MMAGRLASLSTTLQLAYPAMISIHSLQVFFFTIDSTHELFLFHLLIISVPSFNLFTRFEVFTMVLVTAPSDLWI